MMDFRQKADDEIIALAKENNQMALAELVRRYLGYIYSVSYRYLKSGAEAEDATQETFVKVWRNLSRFDTARNFSAWLAEIAKNTCLDLLRRRREVPFSAFELEDGTNPLLERLAVEPVTSDPTSELMVGAALGALPERARHVLDLYYREGFNFREISQRLGRPLNTVKSWHRRALLKLRRLIVKP